jgi:diketogulonate reductase-like aldo/keto reductase
MELLLRDTNEFNRPVYNQMELHPLFQQKELVKYLIKNHVVPSGYMSLGSPRRPGRDRFPEHQADMQHPVIQRIAQETGLTPPQVCLAWAHQRENHGVGYVSMAERSEWIKSNLETATKDLLNKEQFEAIDGDGTEEHPGINSNNRLIWGQVFLWPEARLLGHPRYVLWDDKQIFETRADYQRFKKAVGDFYEVWQNAAVDLPDAL